MKILLLILLLLPFAVSAQTITGAMECKTSNSIITWDTSEASRYLVIWIERRTETGQWSMTVGGTDNTGIRKQYISERYYYRMYMDGIYSNVIMLEPCVEYSDYPVIKDSGHVRKGIYDMQGRRLNILPDVPGMYIVDGKKVRVL